MVPNRSDWIIIGISGVTCGGKTSLAEHLKEALTPVHVFNQDKYFYPDDSPQHIKCEGLDHNNYDVLSALDMSAMFRDMCDTLQAAGRGTGASDTLQAAGRGTGASDTLQAAGRGTGASDTLQAAGRGTGASDTLQAAGRGTGASDTLQAAGRGNGASDAPHKFRLAGKKFMVVEGFTVLNYKPIMDICDLRYYFVLEYGECALRRSYRLYEPPDVAGYFERCVWPEHIKYRAEIERDGRVKLIDGTERNALEIVMADLQAMKT